MLSLGIAIPSTALSRRSFLLGVVGLPTLALTGLGTSGVTQGFAALPQVTGYTATAGRFRRAQAGFVRCAANAERLCFDGSGNFTGQYLQGADTYYSAPWDDPAAGNTSSDPAYLTSDSGDRVRYAGEHTEADIFGGTGGGVVIRSEATNQLHTANNASVSVVSGDIVRYQAIVAIDGATEAGRVDVRGGGTNAFAFAFNHDASGNITGFSENWTTYRADYHNMGTINGKRWWYLWVEREITATGAVQPGIGFGNIAAQSGKSYHVCELMLQKNPATPPAAVPVCKASATFAADTLATSFSNIGYVCEGLAMARSQAPSGNVTAPSVNIGVPYEPLETRITMIDSVESADRSGIMPNANEAFYNRPWKNPTNFVLRYGPGYWPSDWLRNGAGFANTTCVNATVEPVFQATEALACILGPHAISSTFVTGNFTGDRCIFLGVGDPRTKYMEQSDVLSATGSTFHLTAANDVLVENCLVLGGTLDTTRMRYAVQADDSNALRVNTGELSLQSGSGGKVSVKGTRTHALARTALGAVAAGTSITIDTDDFCATRFWMDQLFMGRGTITAWTGDRMFGALTTAHSDMFVCQSERPIRISTDGGATWADLSPSFDPADMPHGVLGEHIGAYDFDTSTFTSAPDATKSMRVRYWELDSIPSPAVDKPGFQYLASRMDMGDYTRFPETGDVFRIKNGEQWIDVTYQGGQ